MGKVTVSTSHTGCKDLVSQSMESAEQLSDTEQALNKWQLLSLLLLLLHYNCYYYLLRGAAISTKYSGFTHHGFKMSWLSLSMNKFAIIFLCALVHSVCTCFTINTQSNDCPYFCSPTGRSRKWLWVQQRSLYTEKTKCRKMYRSTAIICEKVRQLCKHFAETWENQAKEYTNEKDIWFQSKGHFENFLKNHFLNTMTIEKNMHQHL